MNFLSKKFKNVSGAGDSSQYKEVLFTILCNMLDKKRNNSKTSVILAGDMGTGKSTLAKTLSDITGLPMIRIEAPHITERITHDQIISIPYGKKEYSEDQYELRHSFPILLDLLANLDVDSDAVLETRITQVPLLRELYNELKMTIKKIRANKYYKGILFVDECYRTDNPYILRTIRNISMNKDIDIRLQKIPETIYCLFASNFKDSQISKIPKDHFFAVASVETPTVEEFMAYVKSAHYPEGETLDNPDDENVIDVPNVEKYNAYIIGEKMADKPEFNLLNPTVFNVFAKHFLNEADSSDIDNTIHFRSFFPSENDISNTDSTLKIRISPRRVEEIIVNISNCLPCSTKNDVSMLYAYVHSSFLNIENPGGGLHQLFAKYDAFIKEVVERYHPDWVDASLPDSSQWTKRLEFAIDRIDSLGIEKKRYIPTLVGANTAAINTVIKIAHDRGMIAIHTKPSSCYTDIINQYKTREYCKEVSNKATQGDVGAMEEIKQFPVTTGRYRYMLLLDKLNSTNPAVYNSVRLLLLDKKINLKITGQEQFPVEYKLPDDILIIAALNLPDTNCQHEEMPMHIKDVLEPIIVCPISDLQQF